MLFWACFSQDQREYHLHARPVTRKHWQGFLPLGKFLPQPGCTEWHCQAMRPEATNEGARYENRFHFHLFDPRLAIICSASNPFMEEHKRQMGDKVS